MMAFMCCKTRIVHDTMCTDNEPCSRVQEEIIKV